MTLAKTTRVLATVVAVVLGLNGLAQDVEPPFTWAGNGTASFISESGINDVEFQFELSIDEQGMVDGKTSNEDGTSKIKHVFYTERKEYGLPGFFTRQIVLVLIINEDGGNPMISVVNGRILVDKFLYGEMLLAQYEEGSDTAKALGIGDPEATLMEEDSLPASLSSALKRCVPFGMVRIDGDYKKEGQAAETTESHDGSLFNTSDLKDGHTYFKETGVDASSVWKVQDGALWCKGAPVGYLRTKEQYDDFMLVLDWRWPEKPGNSGVLLRMSGEEKIWPLCMEAQLMHTRAGDFVGMGCHFNENKNTRGGPIRWAPRMKDPSEKEPGSWNTYEIVCKGDTITLTVNGQLQNKATGVAVRKGYVGLQSEGAPIMFRNIKVTPLR